MSLRYRDKVVIVTGGSKGIGRGVVRAFVAEGAKVVFCARGGAAGETLEAELNKEGPGTCLFVPCDVSKEDDIKRLIAVTVERHGRIDCLVNNAGWHPPHIPTDDTSAEDFRDLLNLNLISYFLAAKFALPHLRKTQGSIINVSSLVGIIGQKYAAPYVATKCLYSLHASRGRHSTDCLDFLKLSLICVENSWGAITAMSKAMAVDESRHNVRVNTISPGNVMTPLWRESAAHNPDAEAAIREGETWQLLGRMGTEEECGKAALFLAADATFCTGIDLLLSGGAELNYGVKSQISS